MSELMEQARELATHAAEIKHLQSDMDKMVEDMEEMDVVKIIRKGENGSTKKLAKPKTKNKGGKK